MRWIPPSGSCTCPSVLPGGYRYDPPTGGYVHTTCGLPFEDGPTPESVLVFVDRILARREREGR